MEREPERKEARRRIASLDAFRGLTIIGMLLVNNVALDTATPKHLMHAPWNQGIRFADMVFPWFLLIVGVAIPFAFASHRRKQLSIWDFDLKALSRAVILVLLGCLVDSSLAKYPVFGLGVLQIIGLAYLVAALLYPLHIGYRIALAGLLLVAHWAAIRFVPIPGVGAGVFTESTNLINHLNQAYLAPIHLKGITSLVPTSALVLIGTALGDAIRRETATQLRKLLALLITGAGMALIGWLWNLDLPFNKPLWTSAYILYAAGWGSIVLGILYLVIDVWSLRSWSFPLVVMGMNAITAYVLPILVKVFILQEWKWRMPDGSLLPLQQAFVHYCTDHAGRIAGGWLYTLVYILFWWLVLFQMYRKKIFLRV